jgi:hypothetical protein
MGTQYDAPELSLAVGRTGGIGLGFGGGCFTAGVPGLGGVGAAAGACEPQLAVPRAKPALSTIAKDERTRLQCIGFDLL